jgi:hypothetical protein
MKRVLVVGGGLAAWIAAAVIACSTDTAAPGSPDGGSSIDATVTPPFDSGNPSPVDSGTDADSGGVSTDVLFASDETGILSATRLCFLASTTSDDPAAGDAIDIAAQPPSGMAAGDLVTVSLPIDVGTHSLRTVVFYQDSLQAFGFATASCAELMRQVRYNPNPPPPSDAGADDAGDAGDAATPDAGSGVLIEGADWEYGGTLTRGALVTGTRYVVMLTGCPRATPVDRIPTQCPNGFDGTRSGLRADFYALDPTAPSSTTKNRMQFIPPHGIFDNAPQFFGFVQYPDGDGGIVEEAVVGPNADGGTPLTQGGNALPRPGTEVDPLSQMAGVSYTPRLGATHLSTPVALMLADSHLTPADLKPGKAFAFMLIGSPFNPPSLPDGGSNPQFLHAILVSAE